MGGRLDNAGGRSTGGPDRVDGTTSRLVARIGKAHGLGGEVTVRLHTDDPLARFAEGSMLETEAAAGSGVPRRLTVRSARCHNGTWLIAFEEVPDRTGAEGLRDTRLLAADARADTWADPRAESQESEDAWYADELTGLPAYDPHGDQLGEVTGVEPGAAQDLLVLRLQDGRTGYVPFVRQLVPVVDVAARRVVVDAPPGLFDLE